MFFIVDQVTILKQSLALIWADFLEVRLEWEKISPPPPPSATPPFLKLVRIMLETSNLARKYTPICSFRKYTF